MKELKLIENELVPVYETSTGEKVVNGRELWTVLEAKTRFNDWIKERFSYIEAIKNVDFTTFTEKSVKGRPNIEYIIKLDTAKEMAMLERNEKGKQVRRYFIEVEKKYKTLSQNTNTILQVPFDEIVKSVEVVANSLNANDASKLLMYDKLYSSYGISTEFLPKYEDNGSREIRPATELLKQIGANISTVAFNKLLVEQGYLEMKSRKSTANKDKEKHFKALTKKGLEYGENLVSPKNQREVQPLYYADSFQELYDLVTVKEGVLA